jgi:hypothetical protein
MAGFSIIPHFESTACEGIPPELVQLRPGQRRAAGDIVAALHQTKVLKAATGQPATSGHHPGPLNVLV